MPFVAPRLGASVSRDDATGRVEVALANNTSRRSTFWVTGVSPEVGLTLDGNTNYTTTMRANAGEDVVIRLDGPDGEVIARLSTEV